MSLLLPVIILQEERKTSPLFVVKKTNDHLRTTSSFVFRGQKANGHLGTTFHISLSKNGWPFEYSFQNFVFRCEKNRCPFGYNRKTLYFGISL